MIATHPYNTWPLHVKLFTAKAVELWNVATKDVETAPLPLGFTCQVELEGVDGKSGLKGSGRQGPIQVGDGTGPADRLSFVGDAHSEIRNVHLCVSCEKYRTARVECTSAVFDMPGESGGLRYCMFIHRLPTTPR